MVDDKDLKAGQPRLLTVDNQLVVPVGKKIRVLTTSADVIHSFFVPSLGVQRYAIPGRTIETWIRDRPSPATYYGECNQICGTNHSRMPIQIHAVTPEAEFEAWLVEPKTRFTQNLEPAAPSAPARDRARTPQPLRFSADPHRSRQETIQMASPPPTTRFPRSPIMTGHDHKRRRSPNAGCSAPTTRTSARSI